MCAAYLTAGLKPGSISDSAALAAAIGSHCTASVHASLRASSGCHCSLGAHRAAPYLGHHTQACSHAYMYQQASCAMPPPAGSCCKRQLTCAGVMAGREAFTEVTPLSSLRA